MRRITRQGGPVDVEIDEIRVEVDRDGDTVGEPRKDRYKMLAV